MRRHRGTFIKLASALIIAGILYYYAVLKNSSPETTLQRSPHNKEDLDDSIIPQQNQFEKVIERPPGDSGKNNDFVDYDVNKNKKENVPFEWEMKNPSDYRYPQYVADELGNYEESETEKKRAGAGEYGDPVELDKSLDDAVKKSIAEFGFNLIASDRISLDRAPKDLRHAHCKHWNYPPHLPTVSVVIVFHNEGWSPLIRTVHNVINYSPKKVLHEIIMIDDGSAKPHLKAPMDEYLTRFNGLVKLYRNQRREGLIRARSIGGSKATGEILVYLDAHCEAGPNWLPPLITPIMNDRRACTVPLIDVIDGNKYTFTEQAGGDAMGLARGAWDWSFSWKRIPITKQEKARRQHDTEPYRSPAMAGGLFAINREYFNEIGMYDDGLEVWGGENFELSYKLWMCGGQLLFVPCSRVGHVYRLPGWRGNPPPAYVPRDAVTRNYRRVIDVWWDEYSTYFYKRKPESLNVDPGDLTKVRGIRKQLQCRSFKWFMETIAYDIPKHYPMIEPPSGVWGKIQNAGTDKCLDGKYGGSGAVVHLSDCNLGGELQWWLTWHEDVRPGGITSDQARKVCLDCIGRNNVVSFWECHQMQGNQLWKYLDKDKQLYHSVSQSCMEYDQKENKIFTRECDKTNTYQQWTFSKMNMTQLNIFNSDMHKAVLVKDDE